MSRPCVSIVGLVLALFVSATAAADDHKGAVITSMKTDLKSSPAEHIVTLTVDKKEVEVRFSKAMKAYDLDGKEVAAGSLAKVFTKGNTVDVKTEKDNGVVRITEARLIKKGSK